MIGSRVGTYEISAKLGEGGMGAVYRATDTQLGREVALKFLPPAFSTDPDRLARFDREARLLASLNHPNIAQIYGLERNGTTPVLVMELVEGPTLADRLASGPLPLEECSTVALQLAEALEEAHEKGIVHRDLKPQNIKISGQGKVKVLDFGLAKAMAEPDRQRSPTLVNSPTLTTAGATELGILLGTAAYMAPEQARGSVVDKRADIWAFGVILHEMLTGRSLFAADNLSDTLAGVLRADINLRTLPHSTPAGIRRLLLACLQRNPRNRLRDIGDARIALDPTTAPPHLEAPRSDTPTVRGSAWRTGAFMGGALLLSLFAFFGGRALRPASETFPNLKVLLDLPAGWTIDVLNRSLALSPDGTLLALELSNPGHGQQLFLRRMDRLVPQPLEGTGGMDNGRYPFWSPDGKSLGFFAEGKLKRLEIESGSVRTLCDAPSGRGGSWSPRGTIVFAPAASAPLAEVPASGGLPKRVACPDAECQQRLPQYLPDGRRTLFYWLRKKTEGPSGVYVFDPAEPVPRPLLPGESDAIFVRPHDLAFVREGTLYVQRFDPDSLTLSGEPSALAVDVTFNRLRNTGPYAFSSTGGFAYQPLPATVSRQLAWYDRQGRRVATIGEPAAFQQLSASPDGRRAIAFLGAQPNSSIPWLIDLQRGLRTPLPDVGTVIGARWSNDGNTVGMALPRGGIVLLGLDGTAPRELVAAPPKIELGAPLFLSDGSGFVYGMRSQASDKQGDVLLHVFGASGGPRTLIEGPANEWPIDLSPDGRWLLYSSTRPGGPPGEPGALYLADFPGVKHRHLVATDARGGAATRFGPSHDMFYMNNAGAFFRISLPRDGDRLEVGTPEPVFGPLRLGGAVALVHYVRARDQMLVASDTADVPPPQLVLVSDWRAQLRH